MKFAILTQVPHFLEDKTLFSYAPYVCEMNIWGNYVDQIILVAPISDNKKSDIDTFYLNSNIDFHPIKTFDILSIQSAIKAIFKIPKVCFQIFSAMQKADHIHLRCPGNVGLLGCIIQILFPSKSKTAKYAGNWDPSAKNPWSYKLQKYILSNTFLTRNMQVLVYGKWQNDSINIKPFFTATYLESEKKPNLPKKCDKTIKVVFVGTLSKGKRPLYAIQLIEKILSKNQNIELTLYGEGIEREIIENYISVNELTQNVFLKGNQSAQVVKKAYQESHFVLLPSKSEGWPKAIAEGMFWGCVPIATAVSCVPYMIDYGNRGILIEENLKKDSDKILFLIQNDSEYQKMKENGVKWSRKYTLDYFEQEIKLLLQA